MGVPKATANFASLASSSPRNKTITGSFSVIKTSVFICNIAGTLKGGLVKSSMVLTPGVSNSSGEPVHLLGVEEQGPEETAFSRFAL